MNWTLWLTIIGMGAVTLAIRLSFILMSADAKVPALLRRSLAFIAAAVLPALVVPDVLFRGQGALAASWGFDPVRLVVAIIAGLVAWKSRSIFATLGVGMALLWLARLVMPT